MLKFASDPVYMLHRVGWITDESIKCRQIEISSVGTKVVAEVLVIMLDRDSGETFAGR